MNWMHCGSSESTSLQILSRMTCSSNNFRSASVSIMSSRTMRELITVPLAEIATSSACLVALAWPTLHFDLTKRPQELEGKVVNGLFTRDGT